MPRSYPGKNMPGFEAHTRQRAAAVVTEVSEGTATQLDDVADAVGVAMDLPALEKLPTIDVAPPPLQARRQETWLMLVLGAGFGLGVALTLSRLVVGLVARMNPVLEIAGAVACVAIGLAVTFLVVKLRALLHDRALLDRWAGEGDVVAAVRGRGVGGHPGAGCRVGAEQRAERRRRGGDRARYPTRSAPLTANCASHGIAAARAAAVRDREMPTVQAALDAVRAELGEPGIPHPENQAEEAGETDD